MGVGGATLIAAPPPSGAELTKRLIPVETLSTFQKLDMKNAMRSRAVAVLKETLGADDAAPVMRLVLLDAGSYDVASKAGGLNASVLLSGEELGAADAEALAGTIAKLRAAKEEVDARTAANQPGQPNISWADLLVLAGVVATKEEWKRVKLERAETPEGGKVIAENFGTAFDVKLGRVDSTQAGSLAVPGRDASIEDIKAWLNKLGNRKAGEAGGYFSAKPPFWERPGYVIWTAGQLDPPAAEAYLAQDDAFAEWKKKYDFSKKSVTRTDYEVDFVDYYNRLVNFAQFDDLAYCFPLETTIKL